MMGMVKVEMMEMEMEMEMMEMRTQMRAMKRLVKVSGTEMLETEQVRP